jgi:murein DD-endopeptidase MepM/ murein hydrolase activator NlpD
MHRLTTRPDLVGSTRASRGRRVVTTALTVVGLSVASLLVVPAQAQAAAPTWQQVEEARGSEASKKEAIAEVEAALEAATNRAADAQKAADAAGEALVDAQAAADEANARHVSIQKKADEAGQLAESSEIVVGQAAAMLVRPSNSGNLSDLLSSGDGAEDVLRGLSMSSKIGENLDALRERAVAADNLATSLADQAKVALDERDRLADEADAALDEAVSANEAAKADASKIDTQKAMLAAQLVALQDDRVSIEEAYRQAKAAEAAAAMAVGQAGAAGTGPISVGAGSGPGTTQPDPGTGWVAAIRSFGSYQAYGYRIHPITGAWKLHAGADFGASCGTPIYSIAAGTVTYAGPAGGYGNLVIIDHGNGISSAYGHMESSGIYVAQGQTVTPGQNIAGVGTAGGSTGCHLHLEVRQNGLATDPVAYLATQGVR